jgi:hypothetical protein
MAYLDSDLDTSATIEVNQHLESCSDCQKRFSAEQRLEAAVVERLRTASADEQPVFDAVLAGVMGTGSMARAWLLSGVAVAALIAVFLFLLPSRLPDIVSAAALDHAKYRAGTMEPELPTSAAEEVRSYLEPMLGISLGTLPESEGWRIFGPRLCHFDDVEVGLVMFELRGQPVSLFVLSESEAARFAGGSVSAQPSLFALARGHAVLASDNGIVRCAVGEIPIDELTQLVGPSNN